jgi:tetratricopeptide (TPR) repeat protein
MHSNTFHVMDTGIYICCPGEFIIYRDDNRPASSGGLYRVSGVKAGKVELVGLPHGNVVLSTPQNIIDSGEYGLDNGEVEDETDDVGEADEEQSFGADESEPQNDMNSNCSPTQLDVETRYHQEKFLYLQGQCYGSLERLAPLCCEGASVDALTLAARSLMKNGEIETAMAYLDQAHHMDPDNVAVMCLIGDLHYLTKSSSVAETWYQAAAIQDTSSPLPYFRMADMRYKMDSLSFRTECLAYLNTCCLECNQVDANQLPTEASTMYLRCAEVVQALGGDFELAIRSLLRVINIASHHGALGEIVKPPAECPARAAVRHIEKVLLRNSACRAFFLLGGLLEGTGKRAIHGHILSATANREGGTSGCGWETVARQPKSSKKAADPTKCANSSAVPGKGYLIGAYGSYWMCCSLGSDHPQYATFVEAVNRIKPLL